MKAVLIIHNVAIDEEVNEVLTSAGIECYTKFPNILGKGELSEPHLNTEVWPAINCGTLVVIDQDKAKQLMDNIRQMRTKLGKEGLKAFMWEIEEVT
jgi:nitrogen regulatory protein PII